jgi:hypothetical protein
MALTSVGYEVIDAADRKAALALLDGRLSAWQYVM